jgi:hypothetical protein
MNEFEWRRQLRDLRQPQAPRRDLWAAIAPALDHAAPSPAPARRGHRALLAAGLAAVALLAVGVGWHLRPSPRAVAPVAHAWKPSDPRLAGAAIELSAARMELRQALQLAPQSPALQRLLTRTRQQQAQLQQRAHDAG